MPHSAQVTAAEISRLAGVTRATVSNWRRRHPDFPAPQGGTDASPAYDLDEVRAWLAARGQLPALSPADDLRTALRSLPPGSTAPARILPLVLAAARLADVDLKTLVEIPDRQLPSRAQKLARAHAEDIPGADNLEYDAGEAHLLRALLRCVREQGPIAAADVLAERDNDDSGAAGAYDTPAPLAELMADLLTTPGAAYPVSVFDPASGAGGLLMAAAARGARTLCGQDLAAPQAAQAAVRLAITAPTATSQVRAGDSLRADAFPDLTVDAALCAPPYGNRDWGHEELAYDPRWIYGLPPRGEPELAWVQHCLAHLHPGAPAVMLLPPATAERASGRRLRAELLRDGALHAIVALPSGAAAPVHIGLHLWILQRPSQPTPAPQTVLFIDAARTGAQHAQAGPGGKRPAVDWPDLRDTVLTAWRAHTARPNRVDTLPGPARAVPVIDLLNDTVDLTPARHVRSTPVPARPDQHAATVHMLRTQLRDAATTLATLNEAHAWPPTGTEPRTWRSATIADLLRGDALTLLRSDTRIEHGDVILPEIRGSGSQPARVADARESGQALGRNLCLLRPDPQRLDPWFLAGFLAAEDNINSATTGTTVVRVDARRLRVPLMPIDEQRRYGDAFQHLHTLREAAETAARLAEETARTLASGLTGGALLPPEPDQAAS